MAYKSKVLNSGKRFLTAANSQQDQVTVLENFLRGTSKWKMGFKNFCKQQQS